MAIEVTVARLDLLDADASSGVGEVNERCRMSVLTAALRKRQSLAAVHVTTDFDRASEDGSTMRGALGLLFGATPPASLCSAPSAGDTRALCDALCDRGMLVCVIESLLDGRKFYSMTQAGTRMLGHGAAR